jgi:hypothetical protein
VVVIIFVTQIKFYCTANKLYDGSIAVIHNTDDFVEDMKCVVSN